MNMRENYCKEYLVPSRATGNYTDEFEEEAAKIFKRKFNTNQGYLDDLASSNFNNATVEFYYDFCGFLPGE